MDHQIMNTILVCIVSILAVVALYRSAPEQLLREIKELRAEVRLLSDMLDVGKVSQNVESNSQRITKNTGRIEHLEHRTTLVEGRVTSLEKGV